MIFKRFVPAAGLSAIIECYWIARDAGTAVQREKIIPDGFTEIIFHKGSPYRICMDGKWQLQATTLFAGQISRYFFLENTGIADIIGIKLQPTAFAHLYRLPASDFTNKVADISTLIPELTALGKSLDAMEKDDQKILFLDQYFSKLLLTRPLQPTATGKAIDLIFEAHGMLQVSDICKAVGIGERQLENLFKKQVGLSPKLFTRIIRFNYIFQLVQENEQSWCGLAYEAAFYDQSHFIRNFKSFTGENPSDYAFDKKSFANFFLNRNREA